MLLRIVQEALDQEGWKYEVAPDGKTCTLFFSGRSTTYRARFIVDDETDLVAIVVVPPQLIPESARSAACEFITRVNYGLRLGALDLDLADGEWRFRQGLDVEGGLLSTTMVRGMVSHACGTLDFYHDALMRVAFGGATAAVAYDDAVAQRDRQWSGMEQAAQLDAPDATGEDVDLDAILAELLGEDADDEGSESPAADGAS